MMDAESLPGGWPLQSRRPVGSIRKWRGHAWIAAPFEGENGDCEQTPWSSRLVVLEDGRPLALPHARHDDVIALGNGRFSHWKQSLVLSASDNRDIATNGRTYEVAEIARPVSAPGAPLSAVYDLAVDPVTFDFAEFMAAADVTRQRRGLESGTLVLLPAWEGGIRTEATGYDLVVSAARRRQRLFDLILPLAGLWPAWSAFSVFRDRAQGIAQLRAGQAYYPEAFCPYLVASGTHESYRHMTAPEAIGTKVTGLVPPPSALDHVAAWQACHGGGRKMVVITLRQYGYSPARNSNLDAWATFIAGLDPAHYFPVVVPDTESWFSDPPVLPGATFFPEAAVNIGLRAALSERAYVNLGVNCGPLSLCYLNERARYLMFGWVNPEVPEATRDYFSWRGYPVDGDYAFARPGQHLINAPDTIEVIRREFAAFTARHPD